LASLTAIVFLAVNLAVWWDIPDPVGGLSHLGGVRGIREAVMVSGVLCLFGAWTWKWHKWVGVLIIWASINTLWGAAWVGRGYLFPYYDLLLICALSGWFVYSQRLDPEKWIFVLLALALFNVVWAGVQMLNLDPVWVRLNPTGIPWNRQPTGWLDNNTNLAYFLAMVIPLASVVSWWLVGLLAIPVLLATKTLPVLAALMGILIAKRWWRQGFIFLAFAVFYVGVFDPPQFAGDGVRVTVIKESLYVNSYRPVMGWGVGSFKRVFPEYLLKTADKDDIVTLTAGKKTSAGPRLKTEGSMYLHPSNELVRAGFELGFPVIALCLAWFLFVAGKGIKTKPDPLRDAYAGASVAFLIAILGYQPLTIPPLAISGLLVWGLYEGQLRD